MSTHVNVAIPPLSGALTPELKEQILLRIRTMLDEPSCKWEFSLKRAGISHDNYTTGFVEWELGLGEELQLTLKIHGGAVSTVGEPRS